MDSPETQRRREECERKGFYFLLIDVENDEVMVLIFLFSPLSSSFCDTPKHVVERWILAWNSHSSC